MEDLITILKSAENINNAIEKVIPQINKFGVMLKPVLENLTISIVDITDLGIKRYKDLGYTHKEAITLTMYNKVNIIEWLNNQKINK